MALLLMTITCLISTYLIVDVLMTSSIGISSIQRRQIAELQLLRSSVSSEEFHWRGTSQEIEQWDQALAASDGDPESGNAGDEDDSTSSNSLPPFSAAISLRDKEPALWLDIDLPTSRQHDNQVAVRVQEEDRSRVKDFQLSRLRDEMARKQIESKEEEYPLFDLYTSLQDHLLSNPLDYLPKPNDKAQTNGSPSSKSTETTSAPASPITLSRLIIWSHHLLSQIKRRQLSSWCTSLSVWGLLKTGYPGYLCFEGLQEDVKEIETNIKGMQWAAILVRDEESWIFEGEGGEEGALLTCPLAKQFAGYAAAVKAKGKGEKVRTTCEEVETMKEIVDRLRSAGLPEDEVVDALGLRTKQH